MNLIITLIFSSIFLIGVNGNTPKKIFGGEKVKIFHYPYVVSIQYVNYHICSGVIISRNHILTVASCLLVEKNIVHSNMEILSGTNDLEKQDCCGKIHKVSFIIFHDKYEPRNNWINDIAILKLESPIVYSGYRSPATLLINSRKNELLTLGWGINPATGVMLRYLQKVNIKSIRSNVCQNRYAGRQIIHINQYCFLLLEPTAQITNGNAGSPIMYHRKINGLISLISKNPKQPVIYTRTVEYVDWITEMIDKI